MEAHEIEIMISWPDHGLHKFHAVDVADANPEGRALCGLSERSLYRDSPSTRKCVGDVPRLVVIGIFCKRCANGLAKRGLI